MITTFFKFVTISILFLSTSALGLTYRCQLASQPVFFLQTVEWDGSTPFQTPIQYNNRGGWLRVQSIGLAGHPDYLFEIHVGGRTLLSTTQEKGLKDYNINWKSDGEGMSESLISVACRTTGNDEE
jgi:hypothetical protein